MQTYFDSLPRTRMTEHCLYSPVPRLLPRCTAGPPYHVLLARDATTVEYSLLASGNCMRGFTTLSNGWSQAIDTARAGETFDTFILIFCELVLILKLFVVDQKFF